MHIPLTRRQVLQALAGLASGVLLPRAAGSAGGMYDWDTFVWRMRKLAEEFATGSRSRDEVVRQCMQNLERLDIESSSFVRAVASAYESGNEFWLWQRLLKQDSINGGILNIESSRLVQLHDHPGATGVLRVIDGETEVWQYDRVSGEGADSTVLLRLASHRVLGPGDAAALMPDSGNIHALRSVTARCRMLDFFIPPYHQARRTWYEPLERNWKDRATITCRCIPQGGIA